jgi:hypothetical protein
MMMHGTVNVKILLGVIHTHKSMTLNKKLGTIRFAMFMKY